MNELKPICQSCGCACPNCSTNNSIHLHEEIEVLKQRVVDSEAHVARMEAVVQNHAQQFPHGELQALQDNLSLWEDKYNRLFESHKKIQRVNQSLEDKLLKIADKFEGEKTSLIREVTSLNLQLSKAHQTITSLEEQKELFKSDCQIAVQLLQCNPSNFLHPRYTTLPQDLQEKVRNHFNPPPPPPDTEDTRVPMVTFPPTAVVYTSQPPAPPPTDAIPPTVVVKALRSIRGQDAATQTCPALSDLPPVHHLNGFLRHHPS